MKLDSLDSRFVSFGQKCHVWVLIVIFKAGMVGLTMVR